MKNYSVEMSYGLGVSVSVQANNEDEAIKLAKQYVEEELRIYDGIHTDSQIYECESINYVGEE